jgi:hypothetical protein
VLTAEDGNCPHNKYIYSHDSTFGKLHVSLSSNGDCHYSGITYLITFQILVGMRFALGLTQPLKMSTRNFLGVKAAGA